MDEFAAGYALSGSMADCTDVENVTPWLADALVVRSNVMPWYSLCFMLAASRITLFYIS